MILSLFVSTIPLVIVVATWALLTWWRAPKPGPAPADAPGATLMLDALQRIEPAELRERIAASATTELGAEAIVLYAMLDPEAAAWSRVFPPALAGPLDPLAAATLSAVASRQHLVVARGRREDDGSGFDPSPLLLADNLDALVPLGRGDTVLVAGLRLGRPDPESLAAVDRWRVRIGAALRAQLLRHGDEESLTLASERSAARILESAAMASEIDSPELGGSWSMRFHGDRARPYFHCMYTPTPSTTIVVFGQSIASGVAASLLNVAIKSCCDALVNQMKATVSVAQLTRHLGVFLWRPRNPVGLHCYVLVVDRAAGNAELAAAGTGTLVRIRTEGAIRKVTEAHAGGLPLGAVLEGAWRTVSLPIARGDALLVCTDLATAASERSFSSPHPLPRSAEAILDEAARSGWQSDCLLAAVVG